MKRYSALWTKFKSKEFAHKQAVNILKEKDERLVSLCISDLKKCGWLKAKLDAEDSRIRIYKLKGPEETVKEMSK